jgi:hypothetical protein
MDRGIRAFYYVSITILYCMNCYMFYKICKQLIKYVCEIQYNENFEEFVCLASSFNSCDNFEQVNRSFRCVLLSI